MASIITVTAYTFSYPQGVTIGISPPTITAFSLTESVIIEGVIMHSLVVVKPTALNQEPYNFYSTLTPTEITTLCNGGSVSGFRIINGGGYRILNTGGRRLINT